MSRSLLFVLSMVGLAVSSDAQDRISTTRISTEPTGLRFFVDGVPYRSAQVFLWPEGSKHTIYAEAAQFWFPGQRSTFTGWIDSTATMNLTGDTLTVSAHSSITSYKAVFNTEYQLKVLFNSCVQPAPVCQSPGTVYVGGAAATSDVEQWFAVDSPVLLQASPNPGFVFAGWGPPSNNSTSPIYTHVMKGGVTFANIFAPAKRIILRSEPDDLLVAPDRTPTRAPAELDWGMGTRHTLGAVSPQAEKENGSKIWVFKEWSNGAQNYDTYTVGNNTSVETLTARFVPGVGASFVTSPTGLKLKIDGKDSWPSYNFTWGAGMSYQISAPDEQTDSRGRRYKFKGWSNGGPAAQTVTLTADHVASGFRLIATYEAQSRLTINTNPPGMPVTIDGKECRLSCTVDRPEGAQVALSAAANVPIGETSRFEFANWSDGGAISRNFTVPNAADTTLIANYKNFYRLMTSAEPGNGASFRFDPPSPDGFYSGDAIVNVTADVRPGYRFRRWDGDLSGAFRSGVVSMNVPRVVRAVLDITPFAEESGVRNAAGETPEPLVAPGSIGAIYGVNLAAGYEAGPGNPLAQTIAGVTVRLGSRFLPLVFVSPEQINLQVPSDLEEGLYQVGVKWGSYPEINAPLRVVRNAPGLFSKTVENRPLATALHEDGQEIKLDSPARRGEMVTLFGTGFGPYQRPTADGFPLPAEPPNALLDKVEILIGETVIDAEWAGGAAGQIGASLARFRLPVEFETPNGALTLKVRINGRESNAVLLVVE